MNTTERGLLSRSLLDVQTKAEEGRYDEALQEMKTARALEPKNIYVLALEKQVEQLIELTRAGILTDDQRSDILDSLPGIVERAIDGAMPAPPNAGTAPSPQQDSEKAAAHEWLKNQYFQHAHEYVQKGEYENALAEIRRVYIIDAQNAVARDFEIQIEQLAQLKRAEVRKPPVRPSSRSRSNDAAPVSASVPAPPIEIASPRITAAVTSITPVLPVPVPAPDAQATPAEPATPVARKKGSNLLVVAILLLIAAIGFGVFYFSTRAHRADVSRMAAMAKQSPVEGVYTAPTVSPEQTFRVTASSTEQVESSPAAADQGAQEVESDASRQEPERSKRAEERATEPAARRVETVPQRAVQNVPQSPARDAGPASASTPPAGAPRESIASSPEPFAPVEEPPRLVKLVRPDFPDFVYRQGAEGQVVVQVQIDPLGRPVQARIQRSTNSLLDQAVIDAVLRSEFSPARMSNGPVTSWLAIPLTFKK
jgi:protein TonB